MNHRLGIDGQIPFGIKVREDMKLIRVDDVRCRVNYNCDFTLPPGLRGAILRRVLGRGFDSGPADSLSRLKREAERSLQAVAGPLRGVRRDARSARATSPTNSPSSAAYAADGA